MFFLGDASNNLGSGFLGSGRWNAQKRKAGTTRAQFTFQVRDGLGRNLGWLMCSWLKSFQIWAGEILTFVGSWKLRLFVCLFVLPLDFHALWVPQCLLVSGSTFLAILATDISQLMPISRYFYDTNLSLFYCNQLDCWRVLPPFWFPAGNSA